MTPRPGLRRRLIWVLIALVALTAATVGALSVFLVERSLRAQLVDDALSSAEFNLTVLAPAVGLPEDPDSGTVEESGLLDRFLSRGTDGVWVEFPNGERLSSPAGIGQTEVSAALMALIDGGDLAYEFTESGEGPVLVTGGLLPPAGPTFFFVTSTATVSDATRQLAVVVTATGVAVIVIGALAATVLASRMLRPVRAAGAAAERMAGGDLDVQLPGEGPDEFGRLSASFNTMASSLRHTIGELEDARAREKRFVADVSHELRTPLTGLVNESAMLEARLIEGETVTAEDRTIAGMLDADVRRLRRLVDDLLEISRLDLGATPPAPTLVDIDAFLAALIADRHPHARLESNVGRPVLVEPRGLERIVGNLLDNARHHAPGSEVIVAASLDGDTLDLEVADRGPGVDPTALDRIFERFSTGDPSRGSGTGLGLAIASQHSARMGGSLAAAPRRGGGLAMTVHLPVGILLHDGDGDATSTRQGGDHTSKGEPS